MMPMLLKDINRDLATLFQYTLHVYDELLKSCDVVSELTVSSRTDNDTSEDDKEHSDVATTDDEVQSETNMVYFEDICLDNCLNTKEDDEDLESISLKDVCLDNCLNTQEYDEDLEPISLKDVCLDSVLNTKEDKEDLVNVSLEDVFLNSSPDAKEDEEEKTWHVVEDKDWLIDKYFKSNSLSSASPHV